MIANGAPPPEFGTVLTTGLERQPVIQCFRAPCGLSTAKGVTMDSEDWLNLGMLGSDIGMQWYVLTHQGTQLPQPAPGGQVAIPGLRATFNPNLLIVGAIILAAVLLLNR